MRCKPPFRLEELTMPAVLINRRRFLVASACAATTGLSGLIVPASAKGLAPTRSMRGGSNNYRKGAPIVDRIGPTADRF